MKIDLAAAVVLSALLAHPALAGADEPVRFHLTSAVDTPSCSEVVPRLARHLARSQGVRVDEAGQAQVHLQVLECAVADRGEGRVRSKREGSALPTPTGRALTRSGEAEIGVEVESQREVVLVVRVTRGERFQDVAASLSDHTLPQAVDTVARGVRRVWRKR